MRDEQPRALDKLLEHDIGVLSGTTAFGKTVVAIKLIAERKANTLIIVDKVNLVTQWKKRLTEFLTIKEILPDRVEDKKRGRKKANCTIGQLGAGKDSLSGIIDIAVMQSLNRMGEVKDCMKNYGMIIVDECHHISAFSFETILKSSNAKYVYGLTATPNCLVLTERTAHVELLAKKLSERIPEVISLTGGMGVKRTREIMTQISETPADKPLTLVATGKYIGEGFDEPRLDTLFFSDANILERYLATIKIWRH